MGDRSPTTPGALPPRGLSLGLLMVILTFNFLDRQIVNILAESIKADLGVSDAQIGLLTGFAFALLYTTLGLPIARWAERGDRVGIVAASIALWSAFTVVCGLTQTFAQLVLARVGVGIGEAGCSPASHSLISDYAPREKRASALAIYSLGIPLGSLVGLSLGGLIADHYGWRAAFVIAGAPGLLLAAAAMLWLPEPRRRQPWTPSETADGLRSTLARLRRIRTFRWLALGASLVAFIGYGHTAFYGSFYFRAHGPALSAVAETLGIGPGALLGLLLGGLIGLGGLAGTWLGGRLADRLGQIDGRAYAWVPGLASVAAAPVLVWALATTDLRTSLIVLIVPVILTSAWYGPVYASVQGLVPPRARATAAAVLLFVINIVGLGLGPLCVGVASDAFTAQSGQAEGLRTALMASCGVLLIAAFCFWRASLSIRDELLD